MASSPSSPKSPTTPKSPSSRKKDDSFLGKFGGTLVRRKKAKEGKVQIKTILSKNMSKLNLRAVVCQQKRTGRKRVFYGATV